MKKKTAILYFWVRTLSDTQSTAASAGQITVPKKEAFRLAKEIDRYGQAAFQGDDAKYAPKLSKGHAVASGHSVTIEYDSGQRRYVSGR